MNNYIYDILIYIHRESIYNLIIFTIAHHIYCTLYN